jgi:hypothetical protein
MSTNTYQGSATIYQFPVRPRAVVTGTRSNPNTVVELNAQRTYDVVVGDSWYHEAAIQQLNER